MFSLWRRSSIPVWAVALLALVACGGSDEGGQASARRGRRPEGGGRALPVKVEVVARQDISLTSLKNTTLEAERWVEVRSRTSGLVEAIVCEEGDRVRKNDAMARLDADAAELLVAQRQVAYDEALRNYERQEKMYARNLVSKELYESTKTGLEQAKSLLDQAKLTLSYTTILAPISGVVTERTIEIGNMVSNNQIIFAVADFNPLLARIRIPEKEMGSISVGQEARISVESAPGKFFQGRVKMISPVVDPESGTFKVTIEIPGKNAGLLRPGMFATVFIIMDTHRKALVIPKKALVLEGEGNQVFVYEKDPESGMGKAVRRKIETGFEDSEQMEVVSGLSDGDQVITVGHEGLRPGAAVRLVGEGSSPEVVSADRPGGEVGRSGRTLAGGDGVARMKQMQQRLFERFPKLKEAYDKQVKTNPELATSPEKWQAFVAEMRKQGILPERRRGR